MTATRKQARADLAGLFGQTLEREIDEVVAMWWGSEAQTVLRELSARLGKKR